VGTESSEVGVDERPARTTSDKVGRGAIIVAALIGGWFLYGPLEIKAENYPWEVGFAVGLAGLAGLGYFRWQDWETQRAERAERTRLREHGKSAPFVIDDPRFRANRAWVVPVAILLVSAAFAVVNGVTARQHYLSLYCDYGSVSAAQRAGCMRHVNTGHINTLDTQAARFARGETSECLSDAGPYCPATSRWNTVTPEDLQP
jgi:hypothetical protein